jgi:predicted transcriptional regulator
MALMADFLQTDTHFVPVMENNKVVWVISRSNIKKAIAQAMGIAYIPKHENDQ